MKRRSQMKIHGPAMKPMSCRRSVAALANIGDTEVRPLPAASNLLSVRSRFLIEKTFFFSSSFCLLHLHLRSFSHTCVPEPRTKRTTSSEIKKSVSHTQVNKSNGSSIPTGSVPAFRPSGLFLVFLSRGRHTICIAYTPVRLRGFTCTTSPHILYVSLGERTSSLTTSGGMFPGRRGGGWWLVALQGDEWAGRRRLSGNFKHVRQSPWTSIDRSTIQYLGVSAGEMRRRASFDGVLHGDGAAATSHDIPTYSNRFCAFA
ncbi:hypothetical protein B0H11DRAFT_1225299 [Mycena galericulata]|nr:hypothetical protein B0H11DRAFT_1225299 [Mycena galericulata]